MNKKKKYLIFALMLFLMLFNILGCSAKDNTPTEDFDTFLNRVFATEVQKDTLTLNYSLANPETYGIKNPKVTIGHYTADSIKESLANSENYLATLKKYNYKSLTEDEKLSYDILKEDLELEASLGDFIEYSEGLGPTTGIQAQLPVLLAEYNFYKKEDIDTYLKLLPQVYDYFKEICAFEKDKSAAGLFMNDEVADSIIDQCKEFVKDKKNNYLIGIFNDKLTDMKGLTPKEMKAYEASNKDAVINSVIPAYELLMETLMDLKGTGTNKEGLCHYEKGKEYYEYLIKVNTGSSRPIPELKKMLDTSLSTNMLKLNTIMTKNPEVYDTVKSLSYSLTDPSEIINYLKGAIKKDFPPIPNVKCSIKYVDKSLQDHLSPAMYLIPPLDSYDNNIIYINKNPDYDLSQIFTTIAHEGYPGHLYQSVYFRSKKPAAIRNLLSFGGYAEGWATYVEYYSYHLAGFSEDVADFLEANMAANMALYCRLDMGIHYDGWSLADTAAYLKNYITDSSTIKLLYNTMIEEPALYPEYGIGYLEFMDLRNNAEKALGDKFVLKDFHKFLLDIGPAQFDIIAGRMDNWIKTVKTAQK
ncbi:DUF885 domain-containing protein [Anaerocolumna sp. MB42-C2]|uniref:DUF885 domain-containing protein n=1 Tax=Anaerocolumna sp. MB42-C2 TaxID=3070997 RepID=UPI0027E0C1B2|nr:DUF885 domain-containing protein [Anaerocolumna sp. MB42-C2]WMJ85344.1 DUF885 domain-containing protein [Anaerocolumna sp. MB42-C2]